MSVSKGLNENEIASASARGHVMLLFTHMQVAARKQ